MKKILFVLTLALLTGCAAQAYKTARANANEVKNGMTLAEASNILGMSPTHNNGKLVQWRRGNAQQYNGTATGAIEYRLEEGRIVGIPTGGIFSPAGQALANAEWLRQRQEENEQKRAQELRELAEEAAAAENSSFTCNDKITCSKAFALAQIYVQQNSDQKIQVATDTIIETYNPTDGGKVGMTVMKIPRAGSLEVVKVTVSCNGQGHYDELCRLRRLEIHSDFKPFIERSLAK